MGWKEQFREASQKVISRIWFPEITEIIRPSKSVAFLEHSGFFHFTVPVELGISCGDYVLLSAKHHDWLGHVRSTSFGFFPGSQSVSLSIMGITQALERTASTGRNVGAGEILAEIRDNRTDLDYSREDCIGKCSIKRAFSSIVKSYFSKAYSRRTSFHIGTFMNIKSPVRARFFADGFLRHVGLFGQTGSGKSFALAILLEELYFHTSKKIIVLDLNGDFIHFKEQLRSEERVNHKSRFKIGRNELEIYRKHHNEKKGQAVILSTDQTTRDYPIAIEIQKLNAQQWASLLNLDPIGDQLEYYALLRILKELQGSRSKDNEYGIAEILQKVNEQRSKLFTRIHNLGIEDLKIWGKSDDGTPLSALLSREDWQVMIIDMSTLSEVEQSVVSTTVFATLWDLQAKRKQDSIEIPHFLFIDEAHMLFPVTPLSIDRKATLEWGTKIAGEGRKLGLYLVVSSQLPSKIHEHVLTQCGNMILMRMLSQSDIDIIQRAFSFVPETLLSMSSSFKTGDALVIGAHERNTLVPSPCLVHFEGRKTQEGGGDLKVDWTV